MGTSLDFRVIISPLVRLQHQMGILTGSKITPIYGRFMESQTTVLLSLSNFITLVITEVGARPGTIFPQESWAT